jgi:hypothetical protein
MIFCKAQGATYIGEEHNFSKGLVERWVITFLRRHDDAVRHQWQKSGHLRT